MAGHASACAFVGSRKVPSNHARTAGEKRSGLTQSAYGRARTRAAGRGGADRMRPVASPLTRLVFVVAAASILVVTSATIAPAASVRGASAPDQIVLRGSVVVPRGADV